MEEAKFAQLQGHELGREESVRQDCAAIITIPRKSRQHLARVGIPSSDRTRRRRRKFLADTTAQDVERQRARRSCPTTARLRFSKQMKAGFDFDSTPLVASQAKHLSRNLSKLVHDTGVGCKLSLYSS